MRRQPVEPVAFASICAALGGLTALALVVGFTLLDALPGALIATVSGSFFSGWVLWSRTYDWICFHGRLGGAIIGFCASLLAQYVSWYFYQVGYWFAQADGIMVDHSNPIEALATSVQFTALSVAIAGLFTIPAGIIAGFLCAQARGR